ncbi:MAG: copper homeostasis protein CutC [Planctomycetaceae bacterium]
MSTFPSRNFTLELCTGGIEDVLLAAAFDADRIELNCGMASGGLTPSQALAEEARRVFTGNIVSMIRPREGSFTYSPREFLMMLHDAELLVGMGINGLAVGCLNEDGSIHRNQAYRFREILPNTELVFHRAFDWTPCRSEALEVLIDCGYRRVLTGGGPGPACSEGLKSLVDQADGRIELVACGGIRAHNAAQIIQDSGVTQIHSAAREVVDPTPPANPGSLHFGLPDSGPASYGQMSKQQLKLLLEAVHPRRSPDKQTDD